MDNETLTITDNRTKQSYTIPISHGTIRAMDLRQIKTGADDFGLMTYDPAYMNTASCQSAITYLDGEKGILRYPGTGGSDPHGGRGGAPACGGCGPPTSSPRSPGPAPIAWPSASGGRASTRPATCCRVGRSWPRRPSSCPS